MPSWGFKVTRQFSHFNNTQRIFSCNTYRTFERSGCIDTQISFTIAMKIYILFFSAFLLCKIAGRANTKSIYSSQKTDICDFPEFFTTKVYNCVENLSFHNYRDKLGHFIRCFRKDSFSEVINTLCESNKSMNEIQREYPHCFAIFSLEDEINISSIHEDLMNCIFSNK
ncbi:uncharacterized protein LOC111634871 isoform X2 [Centruroides sculpturatus]|uniref:uncharacterized protein LOC111634871 isoform X2 n=1 Tax=Centruroides sculpturatus TaxID=218467 RepID=UPI000C6E109A|nr:uncharacterized protein LOC111634871 isoform X2 [Centruroides sculpturatus]